MIPYYLDKGIDGELNKNKILERFSKLWDFKIYYFKQITHLWKFFIFFFESKPKEESSNLYALMMMKINETQRFFLCIFLYTEKNASFLAWKVGEKKKRFPHVKKRKKRKVDSLPSGKWIEKNATFTMN